MIIAILATITILLCFLRIIGEKSPSFQASAHLFVGGLIGAYAVRHNPWWIALSIVLCVVEVACFFAFREKKNPISVTKN